MSTLATIHNLHFYLHLMQQVRDKLAEGTFEEWKAEQVKILGQKIE